MKKYKKKLTCHQKKMGHFLIFWRADLDIALLPCKSENLWKILSLEIFLLIFNNCTYLILFYFFASWQKLLK